MCVYLSRCILKIDKLSIELAKYGNEGLITSPQHVTHPTENG